MVDDGYLQHLLDSYRRWLGRELIARDGPPPSQAERLFHAPCVVLCHGTQADPVFNYGNRAALELFELDLAALTSMPSRLSAEPLQRDERARLLARTTRDGYVDDYQGVRISSSGRRFRIDQAIVWNVLDETDQQIGQAATFSDWVFL